MIGVYLSPLPGGAAAFCIVLLAHSLRELLLSLEAASEAEDEAVGSGATSSSSAGASSSNVLLHQARKM